MDVPVNQDSLILEVMIVFLVIINVLPALDL